VKTANTTIVVKRYNFAIPATIKIYQTMRFLATRTKYRIFTL